MWKKFLCWSLGHKTMVKGFTGQTLPHNGVEDKLYKWQREKYCIRCGEEVWKNGGSNTTIS